MKYKLQPLRIHTGWEIILNSFTEYDILSHREDGIYELREDLLQLHHSSAGLTIDLGWYPSFDRSGHYILKIIRDYDWENPLKQAASRSKEEIADLIEKWTGCEFYKNL